MPLSSLLTRPQTRFRRRSSLPSAFPLPSVLGVVRVLDDVRYSHRSYRGHLAVLKLTGSILLAALAIPALPAAAFSLWVFGTAWRKKFPRAAGIFTVVWTAIFVIGGIGLLAGIDLGIFFT
mgnify:CR=1 FL=1